MTGTLTRGLGTTTKRSPWPTAVDELGWSQSTPWGTLRSRESWEDQRSAFEGFVRSFVSVALPDAESLSDRFDSLAARWNAATAHLGSLRDICMDVNYQRIIGMGLAAVPLILREMRDDGHVWGWALLAITGEDVAADASNPDEVREAWIQWGVRRGFLDPTG